MARKKGDLGTHNDLSVRVQALNLFDHSVSLAQIEVETSVKPSSLYRIRRQAISRGQKPKQGSPILLKYIEDAKRSGRPKKATPEVIQKVVDIVTKDTAGRHSTCNLVAEQIGNISGRTIHRIFKQQGFKHVKTTKTLGLKAAMKEARLAFALEYKDWTLEDWQNVI